MIHKLLTLAENPSMAAGEHKIIRSLSVSPALASRGVDVTVKH